MLWHRAKQKLSLQLDLHTSLKHHFYVTGFKTSLANLLRIICIRLSAVFISTHHIRPCQSPWRLQRLCDCVLLFLMGMGNNMGETLETQNLDLHLWVSAAAAGSGCGCRVGSELILNSFQGWNHFHSLSSARRETICLSFSQQHPKE